MLFNKKEGIPEVENKIVNEIKAQTLDIINTKNNGNLDFSLDLVETFKKVNNIDVKYKIVDRRPGDIDACYADPSYAKEKLKWEAKLGIEDMCRDAYNFVEKYKN